MSYAWIMPIVTNIFIKLTQLKSEIINDHALLHQALAEIASQLEYTTLTTSSHEFNPHGYTEVLLLSESHLSIHTWPEHHFAVVEMVTCKPFKHQQRKLIIQILKTILQADEISVKINT